MMPTGTTFKGKKACMDMCKAGKFGFDRTDPEISFDAATAEWGVMEYMNQGTVTNELSTLAEKTGWQFPQDPSKLVGRKYKVPVCFVYRLNAKRKIYSFHEYTDLASLMKTFN